MSFEEDIDGGDTLERVIDMTPTTRQEYIKRRYRFKTCYIILPYIYKALALITAIILLFLKQPMVAISFMFSVIGIKLDDKKKK